MWSSHSQFRIKYYFLFSNIFLVIVYVEHLSVCDILKYLKKKQDSVYVQKLFSNETIETLKSPRWNLSKAFPTWL